MLNDVRRRDILLLAVGLEGGLGALAAAVGWLIDCPPWHGLHGDVQDTLLGVYATLPLLFIFLLCVHWPVGPLKRIKAFADDVIRPWFRSCTLFDLATVALLAGLSEELLFRGLLQDLVSRWFHPWLALACASLLFGLLHTITPTYALLATLMGGYLGWLYLRTGNLLVAVVAHALYDFCALAYVLKGGNTDGA